MSAAIVEGAYLADLLAQPEVLRAVREQLAHAQFAEELLAKWRAGGFARVVLTGMGSSLHALYPLHRRLSARGVASHWLEAAELLGGFTTLLRVDTLLIAVSQSGESAEIVSLLRSGALFGHLIGVTNDEHSTLGRAAGTVLRLCAGREATVSCKTYVATLATLHWLGALLTDSSEAAALGEIEAAESAARAYLHRWREHVAELRPLLAGVTSIFVTGRGDSLASAGTGGLILKESTRLPAEGMSAAAFRHGPLEMADERVFVLVCEGDESVAALQRRLVADIVRGGGRAALLTHRDPASEVFRLHSSAAALRTITEILPVQMLSLALAARGGFEAGRFLRAAKITVID